MLADQNEVPEPSATKTQVVTVRVWERRAPATEVSAHTTTITAQTMKIKSYEDQILSPFNPMKMQSFHPQAVSSEVASALDSWEAFKQQREADTDRFKVSNPS
jgi:hypothetical protein